MADIGAIVAAAVAPPLESTVVEACLACIEHGLALCEHGMPKARMHQRFSRRHSNEDEARVWDVLPMLFASAHAIVVGKAAHTEDLIPVDRNCRRRVQIRINLRYAVIVHRTPY